jgi:hypothetical protein
MIILTQFITIRTSRGKQLEYLLSLPDETTPGSDYRVLLALPPGE